MWVQRWLMVCVAWWLCVLAEGAVVRAEPAHVWVLNSYHPQYQWTEDLVRGVRDEFKGVLPDENLHIEYMDARRMVDDAAYLDELSRVYALKLSRFRPDIIISSDDSALTFLRERRDSLFKDVPIVFCGINSSTVAELEPLPRSTGILEGLSVEANLTLIGRLHPDVKRIVLLSDRTSLGKGMQEVANKVTPRFQTKKTKIEIWDDFTLAELMERVAKVDSHTVFLLLAIHEDRAGHYFSFTEHLRPLAEASPVPIYAMFGMLLGQGVTGGMMNDAYEHGKATAGMAKRVLSGTNIDSMSVVPSAEYGPRFDYTQLARFGIDGSALPPNSQVVGRPSSFYRDHMVIVWSTVSIVVGLVILVLWLMRLVRRMQRAEHELLESQAELRRAQRMELIGRLAGGIAHDFNNLLVPILTCADLIELRLGAALKPARNELEALRVAGSRAADLSRQLLALSRPHPTARKPVDLNAAVSALEAMLRRTVSEGAQLTLHLSEGARWVEADRTRLEQVLVNLVVNASDAVLETASKKGRIDIFVEDAQMPDAPRGTQAVCLRVDDTGVGMQREVVQHIFQPFFSTKQPGRGTGLGLSTVQAVVEQHGGKLEVRSKPNEGSSFRVYVPTCSAPAEQSGAALADTRPKRTATVWVVEDDPLVRGVVVEALRHAGHTVLSFEDPRVAKAALLEPLTRCDLLLTDLLMPHLNGRELWDSVHAARPSLLVLFMSGYDAGVLQERGATAGDLPLLRKPFAISELCGQIDAVLEDARKKGVHAA